MEGLPIHGQGVLAPQEAAVMINTRNLVHFTLTADTCEEAVSHLCSKIASTGRANKNWSSVSQAIYFVVFSLTKLVWQTYRQFFLNKSFEAGVKKPMRRCPRNISSILFGLKLRNASKVDCHSALLYCFILTQFSHNAKITEFQFHIMTTKRVISGNIYSWRAFMWKIHI